MPATFLSRLISDRSLNNLDLDEFTNRNTEFIEVREIVSPLAVFGGES